MHFIWWVIWILLIIWVYVVLLKRPYNKKDRAMHILRKRFASGEITQEEYLEKKKIIEKDMPGLL
jgi:putative membrane protein